MANQRHPDLKNITFWLHKDKKKELEAIAKEKGLTISELIREWCESAIKRRSVKKK
jgi:hypothetical protein